MNNYLLKNAGRRIKTASSKAALLVLIMTSACRTESAKTDAADPAQRTEPRQTDVQNPGQISQRAINVIRKAPGVYVYKYKETLEPIDPYKDYESIRRLTDEKVLSEMRRLMSANAEYKQQFTARCMPVWDYGLEFRDREETKTFLFSFRCNTLKLVEDKLFRDFSPQRTELYALFTFEINDRTSVPGSR